MSRLLTFVPRWQTTLWVRYFIFGNVCLFVCVCVCMFTIGARTVRASGLKFGTELGWVSLARFGPAGPHLLGGSPSPYQVSVQSAKGPSLQKPACSWSSHGIPGWCLGPDLTWTIPPSLGLPCNFSFVEFSQKWTIWAVRTPEQCF